MATGPEALESGADGWRQKAPPPSSSTEAHGGSSGSGGGRVRLPQHAAGLLGRLGGTTAGRAHGCSGLGSGLAATLPIAAAWAPLSVASAEADNDSGAVESSGAYPNGPLEDPSEEVLAATISRHRQQVGIWSFYSFHPASTDSIGYNTCLQRLGEVARQRDGGHWMGQQVA